MNKYFVDTSFWKALVDSNDSLFPRASAFWASLDHDSSHFTLSQLVFAETVTLLKMRSGLGSKIAKKWGDEILQHSQTSLVELNSDLFQRSWKFFNKYHDKGFSFVDCSSFVIMKELDLTKALSFDIHFRQAGFQIFP